MVKMCSMCHEVKDCDTGFRYMAKARQYNAYCHDCERIYMKIYKRAYRERMKAGGIK